LHPVAVGSTLSVAGKWDCGYWICKRLLLSARNRLVYEVTSFRDGVDYGFLVAIRELQAVLAHNPVEAEGVQTISFRADPPVSFCNPPPDFENQR
jgi:hypothetical protein